MAFKLKGRKLGKLDAICAKLKQNTSGESEEAENKPAGVFKNITNGSPPQNSNQPADLSLRCNNNNNNIVGKADLNSLDENSTNDEVLDFTIKPKDAHRNSNDSKELDNASAEKIENDIKTSENGDSRVECFENNDKPSIKEMVNQMREKRKNKPVPTATNRRKSRKAAIPRSITQVRDYYDQMDDKDELAEYEINNQNTNFPPEDCEASCHDDSGHDDANYSGRESLSRSVQNEDSNSPKYFNHSKSSCYSKDFTKLSHSSEMDRSSLASTPLDLSVNKSKEDEESVKGGFTSDDENDDNDHNNYDDDDDDDDFFHPDRNLVIDEEKSRQQRGYVPNEGAKVNGNDQVNHLKDFAESTMNELISMYGFGGGGHHSSDLAKHVPTKNYKNILQYSPNSSYGEQVSPGAMQSVGVSNYHDQPMSSGDEESHDGSQPMKGIYANYVKSGSATPTKLPGNGKLQNDRFTTSSSFINAVYNSNGSPSNQISPGLPNYSKYLKRYNNGTECGGQHCKDLGYREHYHCIDCSFQVFVKKEEMVRHYKWHRKREESLQHGFLRFSPLDNCSKRFGQCTHNGKQTHYHCLQSGCDKVYISTSDVQMHANYHRKDSAIMSEGFQRFRATEDCGTLSCSFYGQRTTHFHCLRSDCKFTFKNKADMEKHKSYHQKDEVLGRDGFKKFMKYEHCMFAGCRYSKVSNHIHCIRSGCDYVLHSTAQLYSHKRKHERRDFESAYKKYRDHQTPPPTGNKMILPRPEYSQSQVQGVPNLSANPLVLNPLIQNLVNLPGMKRQMEWDQTEPLELKKPKLEPNSDVDISAPSTPSARSTPVDKYGGKMEMDDSMDANDSNMADDSHEASPVEKARIGLGSLGENINLSGSLTLPIPRFARKTSESGSAPTQSHNNSSSQNLQKIESPKPLFAPMSPEKSLANLQLSLTSLSNAMPSTLSGSLVTMNPGMLLTVPSTVAGASTVLQPPKSVYTERREKDDSWKTYLVRYTANDPCNPRCQYLYKDHYHCKMDGCLVLFKSKDGVREHARFHELQDRITPIAYQTYSNGEECPDKCQYSGKEKHYHCIWTGCTHVVPYIGPTFGRLEHYRIHEYARAAAGKSYNRAGTKPVHPIEDNSMRRRGRPPKYPKIELPKIPKVELTDEEIRQSQMNMGFSDYVGNMKVINGFRIFSPEDPCPDDRCTFAGKLHYHCARPRCFTITDRVDVLNLHAKDFHSFVKILEGYEFFDRTVSCRRMHCPNNQTNRHFHCTRSKCDYSFIRHSTMAQHEKKHQGGASSLSDLPISPKNFHRNIPLLPNTVPASVSQQAEIALSSVIKSPICTSSGATFLPVSGNNKSANVPIFIPQAGAQMSHLSQGSVIMPSQALSLQEAASLSGAPLAVAMTTVPISTVQALPASITTTQIVSGLTAPLVTMGGLPVGINTIDNISGSASPNVPLTVLLQRGINQIPQPSWNDLKAKMHYALSQNCGRPFCKLKKKDHYHCFDCNQAFSDPARLRSHIGKHGIKLKRSDHAEIAPKPAASQNTTLNLAKKLTANVPTVAMEMDPDEAQCLAETGNMADSEDEEEDAKSSSLNLNPSTFSEMIFKAQEQNKIGSDDSQSDNDGDESDNLKIDTGSEVEAGSPTEEQVDFSSRSGRKIIKTKHEGFMNSGEINLSKQRQNVSSKTSGKMSNKQTGNGACSSVASNTRIVTTASRSMRDDSVPNGYSRWRYNEECQYPKCAYKHSVTHFHCVRDDCGYGFSDRSRLVQHTLRHERIDSITGGELQQYRINQDCDVPDCEYNKKMSHFHCKRCTYSCTDSSKVLTHRKYHAKMDNIVNQGFAKFLAADDCGLTVCPYSRKQNHFHCLIDSCKAPVLGPTQMAAHKLKHDTDKDA